MGEGTEFVFWCLAIGGTVVFIFKLAMLFVGLDGGDSDIDGGFDADDGSSTAAFHVLSLQSVACLVMGTGWMGLAALRSLGWSEWQSTLVGIAFGLGLVFLIGKLMQQVMRLESSGTLDVKRAVGESGTVYLSIPEQGNGQIQMVLQGKLVTLDARAHRAAIPTGAKVVVESVDPAGTLVVSAL